jgi:hypothetical protein
MAPRHEPESTPHDHRAHTGGKKSQDKDRKEEDSQHHAAGHEDLHLPHHPQHKPDLPPRHHPHSHSHEEELGPHTNQPGPIKPEKKITQTGTKDK